MIRVIFYEGSYDLNSITIKIDRNSCFKIDTDWYVEQEFYIEHKEELLNEFVDNHLILYNYSFDPGGIEYLRHDLEDFLNMKFETFKRENSEKYYDCTLEGIAKLIKKPKDPFEEIVL
jgi:hypothetical protein